MTAPPMTAKTDKTGAQSCPGITPLRYSDVTPAARRWLLISAALESTYPHVAEKQGNRRASVILAGWDAWRVKHGAQS